MTIPPTLAYTTEHEWIALGEDPSAVGITAFAAEALGDIVYVALPAVGERLTPGTVCGEIESTKSVSELFAPTSGVVTESNSAMETAPELVGADPYGEGWIFRMRIEGNTDLLDAAQYAALVDAQQGFERVTAARRAARLSRRRVSGATGGTDSRRGAPAGPSDWLSAVVCAFSRGRDRNVRTPCIAVASGREAQLGVRRIERIVVGPAILPQPECRWRASAKPRPQPGRERGLGAGSFPAHRLISTEGVE